MTGWRAARACILFGLYLCHLRRRWRVHAFVPATVGGVPTCGQLPTSSTYAVPAYLQPLPAGMYSPLCCRSARRRRVRAAAGGYLRRRDAEASPSDNVHLIYINLVYLICLLSPFIIVYLFGFWFLVRERRGWFGRLDRPVVQGASHSCSHLFSLLLYSSVSLSPAFPIPLLHLSCSPLPPSPSPAVSLPPMPLLLSLQDRRKMAGFETGW